MLKKVCFFLLLAGSVIVPFYIFPLMTQVTYEKLILEEPHLPATNIDWLKCDETSSISSMDVECDCELCTSIDRLCYDYFFE